MSTREVWTEDGQRFAHIDYVDGVASVSREAMHWLLERAGFRQADEPPETQFSFNGRERLRQVAKAMEDHE